MYYLTCESYIDYTYGDHDIAQEGFITGLKNQLKKLCNFLYKKCDASYQKNKTKHPKIASLFQKLSAFFKRHAGIIEKCNTEEEIKKEKEVIEKTANDVYEECVIKAEEDLKSRLKDFENHYLKLFEKHKSHMSEEDMKEVQKAIDTYYEDYRRLEQYKFPKGLSVNDSYTEYNRRCHDLKVLTHDAIKVEELITKAKKIVRDDNSSVQKIQQDSQSKQKVVASKPVVDCCNKKDIKGLRYIFLDSLDVDPTFIKYIKDWNYAKLQCPEFLEQHKELAPFSSDTKDYNTDYWVKIKLDLKKNFSEKRFNHLQKVAKVFYAKKIQRLLKEREEKKK